MSEKTDWETRAKAAEARLDLLRVVALEAAKALETRSAPIVVRDLVELASHKWER